MPQYDPSSTRYFNEPGITTHRLAVRAEARRREKFRTERTPLTALGFFRKELRSRCSEQKAVAGSAQLRFREIEPT
jgi:hypothetical protein